MKFFSLKLKGGLGNQLFQYAAVRNLMHHTDRLFFDTSDFKTDSYGRQFALKQFEIKGTIPRPGTQVAIYHSGSMLCRLLKKIGLLAAINENGFTLHRDLKKQLSFFNTMQGFWQSQYYFSDIRPQLLKELTPKMLPALPSFLHAGNKCVSMHIRRKDYLLDDRFGALTEQYYRDALHYLKTRIPDPEIMVFTDDKEWCKQVFNFRYSFAEDEGWQSDHLQLYLMSLCHHHIIANSSFSWWGAWLNNKPGKIVICPLRPFNDQSLQYEDYYPEEWVKIEN